jgi:hypothetical protein
MCGGGTVTKLSDFAHCDEPTVKLAVIEADTVEMPAMRPACEGFDITRPCDAPGEIEYPTSEGQTYRLCKLHYYKMMCIQRWDEIRRQKTIEIERGEAS